MSELKSGVLNVRADGGVDVVFHGAVTLQPGQYEMTLKRMPDLDALRRLRVHHWRQVCRLADSLCSTRGSEEGRRLWREAHALHMGAVQALNDLFPVGDTAERDMQRMG